MKPAAPAPSVADKAAVLDPAKRKLLFEHGASINSPVDKLKLKMQKMQDEAAASIPAEAATPSKGSSRSATGAQESATGAQMDSMLAALVDFKLHISEKLDHVATKSDLQELKTTMSHDTKVLIAEAVDPLKSEIHDFKSRLVSLESRPAATSTSTSSCPESITKTINKLQATVNKFDPAKRQAAVLGWPDLGAEGRIKVMTKFVKDNFSNDPFPSFGNYYTGPRNDRKLSAASYIEFITEQTRDSFLKQVESTSASMTAGRKPLTLKKARTDFQKERNFKIRKAAELIEASPQSQGKSVKIEWLQKERQVKVDDAVAFVQPLGDPCGTFQAPFLDIVLPS